MIEITARDGVYRKGLLAAASRLSPEEAVIIADLERHGLQVPQLRDVLCGGHVIVDDPDLYEDWRFARISHQRLSSHHRDIDKTLYPDIGMRGLVVREKLHAFSPDPRDAARLLPGALAGQDTTEALARMLT